MVFRKMLEAKIEGCCVSQTYKNAETSIAIDEEWMKSLGLKPYQRVEVTNLKNENRWETSIVPAARDSGSVFLNGACAFLGARGDKIIITAAVWTDEDIQPKILDFNRSKQRGEEADVKEEAMSASLV